jgi:hypothetical protein
MRLFIVSRQPVDVTTAESRYRHGGLDGLQGGDRPNSVYERGTSVDAIWHHEVDMAHAKRLR